MDVAAIIRDTLAPLAASPRRLSVLLVEDNRGDARLMREALRECALPADLAVVESAHAALAYLRGMDDRAAPRPDPLLLDLALPQEDGFALLAMVKADPALRRIPVVVLSGSDDLADVRRSYDLHANCHVAKPDTLEQLIRTVAAIEAFWLALVTLPARWLFDGSAVQEGPMTPAHAEQARLRTALALVAAQAAHASVEEGERLLDAALTEAGLAPTWPQWEAYLRAFVVTRPRLVAMSDDDERKPGF